MFAHHIGDERRPVSTDMGYLGASFGLISTTAFTVLLSVIVHGAAAGPAMEAVDRHLDAERHSRG